MSSKQIYKSIKKILDNKLKTKVISQEEYFHLLNAERRRAMTSPRFKSYYTLKQARKQFKKEIQKQTRRQRRKSRKRESKKLLKKWTRSRSKKYL